MSDNFKFVGGQDFFLSGNGVSSSDTTITLQSFKYPGTNANITMTNFGDTGYGTLEPGTARREFISWTGVTQNANGTATLTGVTRGITPFAPYTADSSYQFGHAGNTLFRVTNSPKFYDELSSKDNDETITGTWTFTTATRPLLTTDADATDDKQFVSKGELNRTALGTTTTNRLIVAGTAGETVTAGDIIYFDETDDEWKLANATFVTPGDFKLGVAQGAGTNGNPIVGGVLLEGLDENQTGLTAGDLLYLSDTGGEVATSAGTNQFELGFAQSTTTMYFFPGWKNIVTKGQKDALAGTSGTPSTSNRYVTDDDTDNAATANKVARYDANGDMIVPTTPTDTDAATSKTYVDNLITTIGTVAEGQFVNVGTSEETVTTVSIPADTLANRSVVVRVMAQYTTPGGGAVTTQTLRVKYGGTTLVSPSDTTASGGVTERIYLDACLIDTTNGTNQALFGQSVIGSGAAAGFQNGTSTVDSTADQDLVITYQSASQNIVDFVRYNVSII